jgi:Prokaryotic lipoprotein-attachment site
MQDASETRTVVRFRQPRAHEARAAGDRARAAALALALLVSGCGLKGSLTLPEKARNVVIRPGPGGEAVPAPAPPPEAEPLPPPELPPDTRGNTRD